MSGLACPSQKLMIHTIISQSDITTNSDLMIESLVGGLGFGFANWGFIVRVLVRGVVYPIAIGTIVNNYCWLLSILVVVDIVGWLVVCCWY